MKIDVEYRLLGCVNGLSIDAVGNGMTDPDNGSYELEVTFPVVPIHWDPVIIILICCDRLTGVSAKESAAAKNILSLGGGSHSLKARSGELHFSDGKRMGRARASSVGYMENNKIYSLSQITESNFNLRIGEEIVSIDCPYHGIMQPLGREQQLITTSYNFNTNMEKGCYGFTNYPIGNLSHGRMDTLQRLTIDQLTFKTSPHMKFGKKLSLSMISRVDALN